MHGTFIQDDHGNISNRIQQVSHQLTSCKTIPEIKQIRDTAEQLRVDAQQRDLGLKLQNRATELKIQAERKLGKSLAEMKLRGGDRKTGRETIRLKDLGIDKNQSAVGSNRHRFPSRNFVLTCNKHRPRARNSPPRECCDWQNNAESSSHPWPASRTAETISLLPRVHRRSPCHSARHSICLRAIFLT